MQSYQLELEQSEIYIVLRRELLVSASLWTSFRCELDSIRRVVLLVFAWEPTKLIPSILGLYPPAMGQFYLGAVSESRKVLALFLSTRLDFELTEPFLPPLRSRLLSSVGPAFAPVIAGVLQEYTIPGWKTMQWFLAGMGALGCFMVAFFLFVFFSLPLLRSSLTESCFMS